MRSLTMLTMIHRATTGRLVRLSTRLANASGGKTGPRDVVRYVWVNAIADVVNDRTKWHITDN